MAVKHLREARQPSRAWRVDRGVPRLQLLYFSLLGAIGVLSALTVGWLDGTLEGLRDVDGVIWFTYRVGGFVFMVFATIATLIDGVTGLSVVITGRVVRPDEQGQNLRLLGQPMRVDFTRTPSWWLRINLPRGAEKETQTIDGESYHPLPDDRIEIKVSRLFGWLYWLAIKRYDEQPSPPASPPPYRV